MLIRVQILFDGFDIKLFCYKVINFINIWVKSVCIKKVYQKVENLQNDMVFYELHPIFYTGTSCSWVHQKEMRDKRILL